ncbi:MAG: ribose ABC transporter permease [Treponema sp.]|jgi:ribose/xylose/arabinose/galactoside ABC-type transport system permease subunit|nr:ribose ABC transporter permease [Treponema sp.]
MNNGTVKKRIRGLVSKYGIYFAFLIMLALFSILNPKFLTLRNIINIVRQITFNSILAMGMTMVIITGGIDLSVGSVLALAAVVTATLVQAQAPLFPVPLALLAGLLIGAVCGFINGIIVTKGKLAPFITTLVMMTIARGAAQLITKGRPITGLVPGFVFIGGGSWLMIPVPIYILIFIVFISYFILNNTRTGRYIYAVGGNEQAAKASGLKVDQTKCFVYVFSGIMASLVGLILAARLNSATPILGASYELDAIAAAVIGGTSMEGGRGKINRSLIGGLIIGTISNGLDILNVSAYWQQIIKGLIILVAVFLDKASAGSKE